MQQLLAQWLLMEEKRHMKILETSQKSEAWKEGWFSSLITSVVLEGRVWLRAETRLKKHNAEEAQKECFSGV